MKKILTIAAASVVFLCAGAQTTTKLEAGKNNEYGLIYSLPRTVLDIVIETETTERVPGEFSNYARRYLNIDDAIRTSSKTATVKSVTIVPRGEADPDNRWTMQFKSGSTPYVILGEANVPLALNTEDIPEEDAVELPVPVAASPTPLETPEARQAVTQEMSQSASTSKRAELAAQRIFELRDTRNDLISGQAENTPPDGRSLQLALDNLSAQEAALTAMFAGTERRYTEVSTITFAPGDEDIKNHVLARLSATEGIVPTDDLSGEPIYLSMQITERGSLPKDDKGEEKKFPKGGVAYNIPGSADIEINFRGNTYAEANVSISQLGVTFGLDPRLFTDKKAPSFLLFNPTTGAIATLGTK